MSISKIMVYIILFMNIFSGSIVIAQTCNPYIIADAPDSRYVVNNNGTVFDKNTNLIWMRCSLGQTLNNGICSVSIQAYYNWIGALQIAGDTVFAGYNDWRLPNKKELYSLIEHRCYSPAINMTAFPNATADWFWSSSLGDLYGIWFVNFANGLDGTGSKSDYGAVRLVRGGR